MAGQGKQVNYTQDTSFFSKHVQRGLQYFVCVFVHVYSAEAPCEQYQLLQN